MTGTPRPLRQDKGVLAWHFVADTLRDGSPVPSDGDILKHDGPLVMCETGLHASQRIIDALKYAPGHTICRVRLWGSECQEHDDKLVGNARKILWRIDGEKLLRKFACDCALDVAHLWDMPPKVRDYLETQEESKRDAAWAAARAARDAAENAARAAAGAAARAAARDATWAAAWAAAWAARDAARDAARAATWAAAWAAAGDAARDAARAAAWAAAEDAARDAQNKRLTTMVMEAHKQ